MPGTEHRYHVIFDDDGHAVGLQGTLSNGDGAAVDVAYKLDELIANCDAIGHAGNELRILLTVLDEIRDIDPQVRQATVDTVLCSHLAGMAAVFNTLFE